MTNNNNNTSSASHRIPEEIVTKITLMAYQLNPHPLKAVLQECLDDWNNLSRKTRDEWYDETFWFDDWDNYYYREDIEGNNRMEWEETLRLVQTGYYENYLEECRNVSMVEKAKLKRVY